MNRVESITQQIANLSPTELAVFRSWYASFDTSTRDQQFESDVQASKLDVLADNALRSHHAGQSRKI